MWFHFLPFVRNMKSVNNDFHHLSWIFRKNLSISAYFHVKLPKSRKSGAYTNIELMWKMILNNAEIWFRAWIFREKDFTHPSLAKAVSNTGFTVCLYSLYSISKYTLILSPSFPLSLCTLLISLWTGNYFDCIWVASLLHKGSKLN